jgi:hypothetical protein
MGDHRVRHIERRKDAFGAYEERWMIEPPPKGMSYRVVEDSWSKDYSVLLRFGVRSYALVGLRESATPRTLELLASSGQQPSRRLALGHVHGDARGPRGRTAGQWGQAATTAVCWMRTAAAGSRS